MLVPRLQISSTMPERATTNGRGRSQTTINFGGRAAAGQSGLPARGRSPGRGRGRATGRGIPAAAVPPVVTPPSADTSRWSLTGYNSSDGDDSSGDQSGAGTSAPKRPKVAVRNMSTAEKKEYQSSMYHKRKEAGQVSWFQKYDTILTTDPVRGPHCKDCVLVPIHLRPSDKLSTGYGGGNEIPTEQKIILHKADPKHALCVRLAADIRSGKSQSHTVGDLRVHGTITCEDELLARTVRTV